MGDDGREWIALVVHGEPGGGHDGQADGFDGFGVVADVFDRLVDGFEDGAGIDLDFDAFAAGGEGSADDSAGDFAIFKNGGFDGGGADVEGEEFHGFFGEETVASRCSAGFVGSKGNDHADEQLLIRVKNAVCDSPDEVLAFGMSQNSKFRREHRYAMETSGRNRL